jgi:hypothetical protein
MTPSPRRCTAPNPPTSLTHYKLKQAPQAWYHCFASLVSLSFVEAKSDTSLFVYYCGTDTAYLLLYVDDIVLTASSSELLQHTTTTLQQQFTMKNLGPLHHFLDVSVDDPFLHQQHYARDILRARWHERLQALHHAYRSSGCGILAQGLIRLME